MKLYLIVGYTLDMYERFQIYGVATNNEEAEKLKSRASEEISYGSRLYEEVEIKEILPDKPLDLNL